MPSANQPIQSHALVPVTSRLTTIVDVVTRVVRPAAVAGLVATGVIALALVPWLFHTTGAVVVWVVIVVVGGGAAAQLLWHGALLRRTLGHPDYVLRSLARLRELGEEHAQQLGGQLDGLLHADHGRRGRAAIRLLADVRNLSAIRALGEGANEIVAPISPTRMARSGWALAIVLVATFLAVPVVLASLLGLWLR